MFKETARALIACGDSTRRTDYARLFLTAGWNVHTASSGQEMLDLLRKQRYTMAVVDTSLREIEPVECIMHMRDLSSHAPATVVADDDFAKRERFWARAGLDFAGPYEETVNALPELIVKRTPNRNTH